MAAREGEVAPAASSITIAQSALDRLGEEAERARPDECCGLLLGREGVIEQILSTANVADDPRHRFEIEPQALVAAHRTARVGGPQVVGYYHSHPRGAATPSVADHDAAAGDGHVWAIVGASGVAFWRDGEQGFEPLSYVVEDS
jgi:desampylase